MIGSLITCWLLGFIFGSFLGAVVGAMMQSRRALLLSLKGVD